MTMHHHTRGALSGNFTKMVIVVSQVPSNSTVEDQVVTTAYIAALFRLHHFAGTKVAFQERQTDRRSDRNRLFYTINVEPMGATDDLRPWIKAFMNKVGNQNATELCWRLSTKLMN